MNEEEAVIQIIDQAAKNERFARDALLALMKMTGSFNDQNPWLGVTSAVALQTFDLDRYAAGSPTCRPTRRRRPTRASLARRWPGGMRRRWWS